MKDFSTKAGGAAPAGQRQRRGRKPSRRPILIEAVAIESAPTSKDEPVLATAAAAARSRPGPHPTWLPMRRALSCLDRHAFSLASLTLTLGIGWLIGANSFGDQAALRAVAEGLHHVDRKVEAVTQRLGADAQGRELASLKKALAEQKTHSETERQQYRLELAWLSERLDAASREPSARLQVVMQRLDAMENRTAQSATASFPAGDDNVTIAQRTDPPAPPRHRPGVELPPLLPASARAAMPQHGYVLRRVTGGTAFVESRDGLRSVELGHVLPGAGRVTKIEKRAQGWVVVTSRGVIDSDLY
jgi:hypothetical protein